MKTQPEIESDFAHCADVYNGCLCSVYSQQLCVALSLAHSRRGTKNIHCPWAEESSPPKYLEMGEIVDIMKEKFGLVVLNSKLIKMQGIRVLPELGAWGGSTRNEFHFWFVLLNQRT